MENNLIKHINLEEVEFPRWLHGKIMRKLFFLRFRMPFLITALVLLLNLLISGLRIWAKIAETEFLSAMNALFDGFEWSWDFFDNFNQVVADYFPIHSLLIFLANLALIAYLVYIYSSWQKTLLSKPGSKTWIISPDGGSRGEKI